MTNGASDQLRKRLQMLQDRFVERAQVDIQILCNYADLMDQKALSQGELVECYQLLHRMAGSAGTFGLPDLGTAARLIEKKVKPFVDASDKSVSDGSGDVVVSTEISRDIHDLAQLFQNRSHASEGDVDSEGSDADLCDGVHGMQVHVMALGHSTEYLSGLATELEGYGFACDVMLLDEPEAAVKRLAEHAGATILLCEDSALSDVVSFRAEHLPQAERRLYPVIGIGHHSSFETLYKVAEEAATAYFSMPLNMPELAERIESLALERGSRQQGRVLIVDDDKELGERYCLVLEGAGIKARLVSEPTHLMSELSAFEPDLVLMDVQLRGFSGVTLARLIRYEPRWLGLPIVYLSSEDDPETQLEALAKGADEFLVKPVTDAYLIRAVRIRCYRARQLSNLMNRDSLTGLLKHSLIKQEVDRELARCRRGGHFSCVVMLDLDHFKRVNDTWGHGQGDIVIRTLAHLLRNRLRESDTIGRYGGEEFLVVLPNCEPSQAAELIDGIRESFAELVFSVGEGGFQATFSAGVALINDFPVSGQAIEAADQALYGRKQVGRNGVTVYDREVHSRGN
ncbi:diguanylate cyclase [Marinobacter sp.]|uniref:diguanylate cyclase n=1 Tax=Marinobacter sp. TaxID=50741 RepID=UPI0035687992